MSSADDASTAPQRMCWSRRHPTLSVEVFTGGLSSMTKHESSLLSMSSSPPQEANRKLGAATTRKPPTTSVPPVQMVRTTSGKLHVQFYIDLQSTKALSAAKAM